ncbi:nucleoside triphosphate pyrophosphatase [Homoserinibacter sp. GY 40078]|uniref:Maf family protein n=1 Tax=Homoserinibacter sp. GY 40078 TaxID=2603275 RepID=UPI0011C9FB1F|nr:nucleoside triphosphate pyrophosphatase [Homoserinibacter sp. GY 40078]TXK18392.1 septum formation inhibitor Maf [Homoserinibacter sp. GY 40078]
MRVRLYLASTSPARLATLRAVGIDPAPVPSHVDEDAVAAAAGPLAPDDYVTLLARAKAEAVATRLVEAGDIDGLVLGGDSAFVIDGRIHGKPHLPETARERWRAQRGRSGVLHSGHWLIDARGGQIGRAIGGATSAVVHFAADITDDEIDAYIATGEPLEVAGAFTIDSRGAGFIDRIEGDPHTVVGLGVPYLRTLVRQLGVEWTSLWNVEH